MLVARYNCICPIEQIWFTLQYLVYSLAHFIYFYLLLFLILQRYSSCIAIDNINAIQMYYTFSYQLISIEILRPESNNKWCRFIFLYCLVNIHSHELGHEYMNMVGVRLGVRIHLRPGCFLCASVFARLENTFAIS